MQPSSVVLIVGTLGTPDHPLTGMARDVERWIHHAPILGGPDAQVFSTHARLAAGQPMDARTIRALARAAMAATAPGGTLTVVVLGHGGSVGGQPGLRTDDGQRIALSDLVDGHAPGCTTTWFIELCGAGGPRALGVPFRADDLVFSACTVDEVAERRAFPEGWRGAWSLAVDLVLGQSTGTDTEGRPATRLTAQALSDRVTAVLQALDVSQTPMLEGDADRHADRLGSTTAPVARPAPRLAMQYDPGNGIVMKAGNTAWVGARWVGNKLEWSLRTGERVADLPSDLTIHWRQPNSSELSQLGGPSFQCVNVSFTNVGSVTAGGGRMYKSATRMFLLAFASDFKKVVFWAANGAVNTNNHIKPAPQNEATNHVTTPPQAPGGGWNKAVDKP